MLDTFNHHRKHEWSIGTCYNMHEHGQDSKGKKLYRKGHPGHIQLCALNPSGLWKWGKVSRTFSEKENWIRMARHFYALQQVVKMEVGLRIKLESENHNDFSFEGYVGVPWENVLFGVKHNGSCHVNWHR